MSDCSSERVRQVPIQLLNAEELTLVYLVKLAQIKLHTQIFNWFGTKRNSDWFQINRKDVNAILFMLISQDTRVSFCVCNNWVGSCRTFSLKYSVINKYWIKSRKWVQRFIYAGVIAYISSYPFNYLQTAPSPHLSSEWPMLWRVSGTCIRNGLNRMQNKVSELSVKIKFNLKFNAFCKRRGWTKGEGGLEVLCF